MKGNDKVIETLNARLVEELTAINQYMVHAEMVENWKYAKLYETIRKRAIVEMIHAEKLIERILFLEGRPVVSKLGTVNIGAEVPQIHDNDLGAEQQAVLGYNESIRIAGEAQDHGTRELLDDILKEEEGHVDWLEAQLDQIRQAGLQNYLAEQIY
ncbi:MAG: Bacterioferritin [Syntrophorhabdaceae bacterium PtaU1.Bin034]|nr:MAG: Bacterioferritin [Syntrophorhabdaceae bacterium PtaU1.Bin034]